MSTLPGMIEHMIQIPVSNIMEKEFKCNLSRLFQILFKGLKQPKGLPEDNFTENHGAYSMKLNSLVSVNQVFQFQKVPVLKKIIVAVIQSFL